MKQNKGLSDKELIEKYEAGAINLPDALKKASEKYTPIKRIVSERVKKKDKLFKNYYIRNHPVKNPEFYLQSLVITKQNE